MQIAGKGDVTEGLLRRKTGKTRNSKQRGERERGKGDELREKVEELGWTFSLILRVGGGEGAVGRTGGMPRNLGYVRERGGAWTAWCEATEG